MDLPTTTPHATDLAETAIDVASDLLDAAAETTGAIVEVGSSVTRRLPVALLGVTGRAVTSPLRHKRLALLAVVAAVVAGWFLWRRQAGGSDRDGSDVIDDIPTIADRQPA